MHIFTRAVKMGRRPSQIRWINDTELKLQGEMIDLSKMRDFLHFKMEELKSFVDEKILFGNTLQSLGITCDFSALKDTQNMDKIGYSSLLPLSEGLANGDSDKLLETLLKQKKLISLDSKGNINWDSHIAPLWQMNIHQAMLCLSSLCHILQGAPGRASEEVKSQLCNTVEGGRRHVFVDEETQTLSIFSNYSKGTRLTSLHKEILRIIPYEVAQVMFIVVRMIRPMELLYISMTLGQNEILQNIQATYCNSLWASMRVRLSADDHSYALQMFFKGKGRDGKPLFTYHMGVRKYRHLATAIQRKFFPAQRKLAIALTATGDAQAGRGNEVSQQHYAIDQATIGDQQLLTEYRQYSKEWHSFWEFATSPCLSLVEPTSPLL